MSKKSGISGKKGPSNAEAKAALGAETEAPPAGDASVLEKKKRKTRTVWIAVLALALIAGLAAGYLFPAFGPREAPAESAPEKPPEQEHKAEKSGGAEAKAPSGPAKQISKTSKISKASKR